MITKQFLEKVMKQTDIVPLIGSYVALRAPDGKTWNGLCPFHRDYDRNLKVSGSKQIFKCFICKTGGDALRFVMLHQKKTFPEAVAILAEKAGIEMETPKMLFCPESRIW